MPKSTFTHWKRGILLGAGAILPLALTLANGNTIRARNSIVNEGGVRGFDAPAPVRAIVQRACANCHSEETKWPWYSHVPPVSWQVHGDVNNARALMNLSHWSDYTDEERRAFALQIALVTRAHMMPPAKYLWMHHEAKLTNAEVDALKEWAAEQARPSARQR